jgi:hypothetical protein
MTLPQIVSLISTVLLTATAIVIGIQLLQVLKELRHSLVRVNQTLVSPLIPSRRFPNQLSVFLLLLRASVKAVKLSKQFRNCLEKTNPQLQLI